MIRKLLLVLAALSPMVASMARGESETNSLLQRHWFETRTRHFNIYSCGPAQEVGKAAARLEQFREAYALLAGAQAVESPPIVVVAFPDEDTMRPFLPLYQGQPGNIAGFFTRGSEENLIGLALAGPDTGSLGVIFHEYTHLLLRRNDTLWPLWLVEGMAEAYSTFETTGYQVSIGGPIEHHLRLLQQQPWLPLAELFSVGHDSPQYNEREHQGIFYSESWLLTQFLMNGDNPAFKARFGQFTQLLREGQLPEQAFTNALRCTLPAMEGELHRYLEAGRFMPVTWTVKVNLSGPQAMVSRVIGPAEAAFRLGDELLRLGRLDTAEQYFVQSAKLAPAGPLSCEGLGLLAEYRKQPEEAVRQLRESLQRGPADFLCHYVYALERYLLTADAQQRYTALPPAMAGEIRGELQKSLKLMPDFGPAHELLGFFETVQGEDLAAAEQHLRRAAALEPENQAYLLALAQAQLARQEPDAARHTLEPLLLPNAEARLRAVAREILRPVSPAAADKQ